MVLAVHSDPSYLNEPAVKSRVSKYFFCLSNVEDPPDNSAVLNISKILKAVMSSATKAKLGALYINACKAIPMWHLLEEMGHKQPLTPIQTDNSTAHSAVTNNIQPCCTKVMDMRFHWLWCRDSQGQFRYYWRPGPNNRADYWTKHHCAVHHIKKCPTILTSKFILDALHVFTNRTPATFDGEGLQRALAAAAAW